MEKFTQIPNVIIDEWMKNMNASSFTVLMVICRKTLGWQKESDYVSQSQIMEFTGLSKNSVIRALKELKDKELINAIEKPGITTNYTLNLTSAKSEPVPNMNPTSAKNEPELVPKVNTQKKKETVLKENSPHHKLITHFNNEYLNLTGNKLAWLTRYNKDIQRILKLDTEEEIYKRFNVLKEKVKENNSTYWNLTPDKLYSGWNDLNGKQIKKDASNDDRFSVGYHEKMRNMANDK